MSPPLQPRIPPKPIREVISRVGEIDGNELDDNLVAEASSSLGSHIASLGLLATPLHTTIVPLLSSLAMSVAMFSGESSFGQGLMGMKYINTRAPKIQGQYPGQPWYSPTNAQRAILSTTPLIPVLWGLLINTFPRPQRHALTYKIADEWTFLWNSVKSLTKKVSDAVTSDLLEAANILSSTTNETDPEDPTKSSHKSSQDFLEDNEPYWEWVKSLALRAANILGNAERGDVGVALWYFERVITVFVFINMAAYIATGKYRTLLQRAIGLRVVPGVRSGSSAGSALVTLRHLLWTVFSDVLLALFPIVRTLRLPNALKYFKPKPEGRPPFSCALCGKTRPIHPVESSYQGHKICDHVFCHVCLESLDGQSCRICDCYVSNPIPASVR